MKGTRMLTKDRMSMNTGKAEMLSRKSKCQALSKAFKRQTQSGVSNLDASLLENTHRTNLKASLSRDTQNKNN